LEIIIVIVVVSVVVFSLFGVIIWRFNKSRKEDEGRMFGGVPPAMPSDNGNNNGNNNNDGRARRPLQRSLRRHNATMISPSNNFGNNFGNNQARRTFMTRQNAIVFPPNVEVRDGETFEQQQERLQRELEATWRTQEQQRQEQRRQEQRRQERERQRNLLTEQQQQWGFTGPPSVDSSSNPEYELRYPTVNGLDLNYFLSPNLVSRFSLDQFMNTYEAARQGLPFDRRYPTRDEIVRYLDRGVSRGDFATMLVCLRHLGVLVPRNDNTQQ